MNTRHIYAIFLRQVYLIRGNFTRLLQIFVWMTIDIILWGFTSKYFTDISGEGIDLIPVLLGAVLLWNFLVQVMQGISASFLEDAWSRNFMNIFASPLRISEYVGGLVLVGITRSIMALCGMLLLASLFFGFSVLVYGAWLALFLFVLFLFGIALGIIGISIVLRLGPSAEWFVWPIPAIISPFVGVIYPLSTLPQWMQCVGYLLPPSYVFSGVRALIEGGGISIFSLVMSAVLAVAYIALAYLIFASVYRKAIRTGIIARYSAENII